MQCEKAKSVSGFGLLALSGSIIVAGLLLCSGPTIADDVAVSQIDGNRAIVLQEGDRHTATVEQNNIRGGLLHGTIQQFGLNNTANLGMRGGSLRGRIFQSGEDNLADLTLEGRNNAGEIEQHGDRNRSILRVEGEGRRVQLRQFGNDNVYTGLTVRGFGPSGPGSISITQRR